MSISSNLKRFLIAAGLLVALAPMVFLTGEVESSGLGQTGHFEYVESFYAQSQPNNCPEGLDCWELCFVGPDGIMGTGMLCCVDSAGNCVEDAR